MGSLKENTIREYLTKINFKSDQWSVDAIREDMRKFLGEEPGIDVTYKKDVIINEVLQEAREIRKIDKVSVVFTDVNDKFRKIEIQIS